MRLMQKIFECESGSKFKIWGVGDMHIASKAFDENTFRKVTKEKIEDDPDSWFIGMGDYGESISTKDKRFDPEQLRPQYKDNLHRMAQLEANECKELLFPIKDKCLGLLNGNHEDSLKRYQGFDLTTELTNSMGVPYLQDTVLYRLTFRFKRNKTLRSCAVIVFATHGSGSARKWGGRINKLADLSGGIRADIYMMGHQHSGAWITERELSLSHAPGLSLTTRPRVGVLTPSFYKAYQKDVDTYASRGLYSPSMIGLLGTQITIHYHSDNTLHYTLSPLGEIS